ncbi:hypothetical protein I317_01259 [Kwoniella heveanensis CBS 569]|nr:hypothetical protein I317_01259 [Kwoniella heveanensis CBS 569]
MFEEDFERCFICEKACKGLYCSSECRLRDQGTPSPAVPAAKMGPVKITSQLPASLSPLVRPAHHPGRSPRVFAQNRASSSISSGSSSVSSSPLQSPQTNPSEADSPKKDTFDLPPPAYPFKVGGIPTSVPMKIPALIPRAAVAQQPHGQTPGSQGSTIYPAGTSIDTLRFGRKPSVVNNVISPNALIPRCACGLPANHKGRANSKDRADLPESGFSRLSLGPSVVNPPHASEEPGPRSFRIVSDSAIPPFPGRPVQPSVPTPSRASIPLSIPQSPQVNPTASLLSRSRSDPIPSSPQVQRRAKPIPAAPAPAPIIATNVITPSHRETFAVPMSPIVPAQASACRPSRHTPNALEVSMASPRRGRSRERQEHHVPQMTGNALGGPADREQAPSRSRNRRDSRRRSDSRERERERERGRGRAGVVVGDREREHSGQRSPRSPLATTNGTVDPPQILPSWSRRASEATADMRKLVGDGVVTPVMRRTSSGDKKSPVYERDEEERERKREELKRASKQLGQVFGVAAG